MELEQDIIYYLKLNVDVKDWEAMVKRDEDRGQEDRTAQETEMVEREGQAKRGTRIDVGRTYLMPRDVAVLRWTAEQYAANVDHLVWLLGQDSTRPAEMRRPGRVKVVTVERVIRERWLKAGWVEVRKVLHGKPAWVWLSSDGLKELGLDKEFPYHEPSPAKLEHYSWVNVARLYVESRFRQRSQAMRWRSERQVVPRLARLRQGHYPDAEVIVAPDANVAGTRAARIAVEVELTRKKPDDIRAIIEGLALRPLKAGGYDSIYYFVSGEAQPGVEREIGRLDQNDRARFFVTRCDALPFRPGTEDDATPPGGRAGR